MRRAFVDTGGFYSLISENDVNHERSLEVFRRADAERWGLVTTNIVMFETYALLLNRTGEGRDKAIQFLDHLEASRLRIERVTKRDEEEALALVRAHRDKSYSLCDALSFRVCERLKIVDAVACDADFRSYGRLTMLL